MKIALNINNLSMHKNYLKKESYGFCYKPVFFSGNTQKDSFSKSTASNICTGSCDAERNIKQNIYQYLTSNYAQLKESEDYTNEDLENFLINKGYIQCDEKYIRVYNNTRGLDDDIESEKEITVQKAIAKQITKQYLFELQKHTSTKQEENKLNNFFASQLANWGDFTDGIRRHDATAFKFYLCYWNAKN